MARRRPRPDPFAPRRFEPLEPPTAPEAMVRRHARASFTPTPQIFEQRSDVEYMDTSRPFFRLPHAPGLNDAPDLHTSKGEVQGQEAIHQARDAAHEAIEGDCTKALRHLLSARGHLGAAVAHSGSGGRIELGTVSSTVERAEAHVAKFCKLVHRKGRR